MIHEFIKILLLRTAIMPRIEKTYSINDINLVFIQVPQIVGYYGFFDQDVLPEMKHFFETEDTCFNLKHRDNYKARAYYQNFARSTIVIYHTGYYTDRRLSKLLNETSPVFMNETINVRAYYGKVK